MFNLAFNIEYKGNTDWGDALLSDLKILFEISDEELEVCKDFVKEGIQNQIARGIDYLGNAVAPKKKGGRIFFDTGKMLYEGVIDKKVSSREYDVTMINERQAAAYYLNTGTKFMPAREFWGIAKETLLKIENYLLKRRG